jgi:hypothetical protein
MYYHAYFYFVSAQINGFEIPDILKLSATLASVNFHQVVVCTNLEWKNIPSTNITVIKPPPLSELAVRHLREYRRTLREAMCYSNHQETEELCLLRWHAYLDYLKSQDSLVLVAMIDWDTFVLQSPSDILPQIGTRSKYVLIYPDVPQIDHPVYSVCPHYLIATPLVVELYIKYYLKLLFRLRHLFPKRSYAQPARLFLLNDMRAWSSVISFFNSMKHTDVFTGQWSELIDRNRYCYDHNIRVLREGDLIFLAKSHTIPRDKRINFTGSDQLRIKLFNLDQKTNQVFCYTKSNITAGGKNWDTEGSFTPQMPICLHFSGTESKYILNAYYMQLFRSILCARYS